MQVIWFSSSQQLILIKIRSNVLIGKDDAKMFEEVVDKSFLTRLEYEVSNVQRKEGYNCP